MRSSIRRGDARLGVWLLAWLAFGAGCGHGLRPVAFYDATELRDERYQASATPPGPVWLRRAVEVRVGVARSPDNARSYLRFHGARLRFDSVDEPRAEVTLTTPAGARLLGVRARVLGHDDEREATPAEVHSEAGRDTVDPDDLRWTLVFAGITAADILEYTADFELATTLVSDARYLSAADGFTREVLIRYDVPNDAVGALQISDPAIHALARKEGGTTILAVLTRHRGPARPGQPGETVVRYVTKRASPAGYAQSFATSWAEVSTPYAAALLERGPALRENHSAPFRRAAPGSTAPARRPGGCVTASRPRTRWTATGASPSPCRRRCARTRSAVPTRSSCSTGSSRPRASTTASRSPAPPPAHLWTPPCPSPAPSSTRSSTSPKARCGSTRPASAANPARSARRSRAARR
jgi:hypothetical protein